MKTNIFDSTEVPVMVKLPIVIFSLTIGITAILGAGVSFLETAMPAAEAGDYYHAVASLLGLVAATLGTPVLAKSLNDWLVKLVAKVW